MTTHLSTSISKKPVWIGFIVFLAILCLTQYLSFLKYSNTKNLELNNTIQESNSISNRLKTSLRYSLSATKTLAFIIENYGDKEDFEFIAKGILNSNKNIDALELTRKGVITNVYPLKGNEKAVGFDVLKNPLTQKDAFKAIEKKELFFAGPLKLKQGGIGLVGRLPIYINNEFWGFSVVIVKLSTLLKAAEIDTTEANVYSYQLSKVNPETGKEEFFLANSAKLDKGKAILNQVPGGDWNFYVSLKDDKNRNINDLFFSLVGLGFSIICGIFSYQIARQPEKLNKLVEERTLQLIDSQHQFKATLDRVSDAFVSLDKNWCYTYMNKTAGELFKRNPVAMIGKNVWEEFPEAIDEPFYKAYHKAMLLQQYMYLAEYYPPNQLWFENHIYPSPDGLTIYFKDITERKLSEQAIIKGKKFVESILNSLPGIFYLFDKNGKFLQWNKNFETISGYTSAEISQMHPLDFCDFDEKALLKSKIESVFELGSAEVEAHFLTKARDKFPYFFNGHITNFDEVDYLMGVGIDIRERKLAEDSLKKSEEKYKYLFNNNPALIIIWDIIDFKILELNDIALEEYGYTREEFLTMSILSLRPLQDHEKVKAFYQPIIDGSKQRLRKTWIHLKKNGERIYMDISSHRIDFDNRTAILSLAKDITEQVNAENQLEETTDDVRRLNVHLQSVREEERISIAREIHDELGQQLTGLKMDAAWLTKKINANETEQRERLTSMIALIDDTVKTVRRISSDLRPGILDDLGLIAALEWQCSEFERRTDIRCTFSSDRTEVFLEKNCTIGIFRIYQESLTNVLRHSQATTLTTEISLSDEYFNISIKDNGVGFDLTEAKNKKTFGLTGMKERARMSNCILIIDSKKGVGTSVILNIPKSQLKLKPEYEYIDS